jgi:hypothetical protein
MVKQRFSDRNQRMRSKHSAPHQEAAPPVTAIEKTLAELSLKQLDREHHICIY